LGTSSNILLWNYQTGGTSPLQGQVGPFSSQSGSGNIVFSVNLPAGGKRVFSIQLNDANTNQPLAVGAVQLDMSNATSGMAVTVLMGSVNRQCYMLPAYLYSYYDLADHIVACNSTNADTSVGNGNANCQLQDPSGNNSIAYLGNGNLVNFDYIPASGLFTASSDQSKSLVVNASSKAVSGAGLDLQTGDIYCIQLTSLSGAYAWIQVTSPGNAAQYNGPNLIFRVSTNPYFSYYQTPADIAAQAGVDGGTECQNWEDNCGD
jgi:hypothetical protein